MTVRWLVATLHLLALGIGLGAVWVRARSLRGPLDSGGLRRVIAADAAWGIAALIWISTGIARAFGGLEKGTGYYLNQPAFHVKMGLLLVILLLEISPMIGLGRWRKALRTGTAPDTGAAAAYSRISYVQAALVVLMVFAATAMARGL
jgi:putative membrane protein